jgi:hypothetical protein
MRSHFLLISFSAHAGVYDQSAAFGTHLNVYASGLMCTFDDAQKAQDWYAAGTLKIEGQAKLVGFGYGEASRYCPTDMLPTGVHQNLIMGNDRSADGGILPLIDYVYGKDIYGGYCNTAQAANAANVGVPSLYYTVPLFPATIPFNYKFKVGGKAPDSPNGMGINYSIPVDSAGIATSPTGTLRVSVNWEDYSRNKVIVALYPLRTADKVALKRETIFGCVYAMGLRNEVVIEGYTPPTLGPHGEVQRAGEYTANYTVCQNTETETDTVLTESFGTYYLDEVLEKVSSYNSGAPIAYAGAGALTFFTTPPATAGDLWKSCLANFRTLYASHNTKPEWSSVFGSSTPNYSALESAMAAAADLNFNGRSRVWQDFLAGKTDVSMPKLLTYSGATLQVETVKQSLIPNGTYYLPELGAGVKYPVPVGDPNRPFSLTTDPANSHNLFGLSHTYLYSRAAMVGADDKTLSMQPYKGFLVPGSTTSGTALMWHWGAHDRRFSNEGWTGDCWYDRLLSSRGTQGSNNTYHEQVVSGVEPGYYLVRLVYLRWNLSGGDESKYSLGQTYFVVRLGVATSEPTIPPPPAKGIREFAFANVSTANGAALGADKLFTYDTTTKKFVPTAVARQEALKNGDFRERVTFDGPMTPEEAANWDVQNSANFCYELVKETDAENPTNPTNPTNPPVVVPPGDGDQD